MFRYLLLILLFIGLYRFIIRIVLPVLRVTSTVRRQMKQMQQPAGEKYSGPSAGKASKSGDYIDFEEVR